MTDRPNLRTVTIRGITMAYDCSSDGRWEEAGKVVPWLYLRRPHHPRLSGWTIVVGAHAFGIHWCRESTHAA